MSLQATVRVPERGVEVQLDLAPGETVALLGENGAGKSTVLGALAGILPAAGEIRVAGRRIDQLPPHRRGVGLLTQDPLLFPHLSVRENVMFGPRALGAGASAARRTAEHWLRVVQASDLADRKAPELSGGQAQRVGLARALATEPGLLLLDEPLAALDARTAPAIRQTLRAALAVQTTLLVTHDVVDALMLADRVVVLEQGRIVEEGPTTDVLARPLTALTARLGGRNLIAGLLQSAPSGPALRAAGLRTPDATISGLAAVPVEEGQPGVAVFSPSAVAVYLEPPSGSPRNLVEAVVTAVEPIGDRVRVETSSGLHQITAEVTVPAVAALGLVPDRPVVLAIKATEVSIYPTPQANSSSAAPTATT